MDNDIEVISKHYQEEELESLKGIFDIFDRDETGFIDISDMQEIMEKIGKNPADA
jgi:Ca2+-binding EF-hand superfamily protein